MDEIFYDPALFDIPYEYQEYPTGDTVEEDNLSADLFGALIQTDAQLPPTPACFGDFTDCPLAPRLSMADYASTSRMSQHEGISNYNIKTRIPDFMRTGGVTTGITPTLPTAAPTLVDYSDNTGTSSIKYSVFDDLAHNQDASPSRDFFSSSGTVSLPSQFYTNSDNSLFDMIAQRGFGSEISSDGHCLSELLYTNNVGPEMAHLFGNVLSSNDMSHGIASPTVEDFSNFPTADPAEDNVIPLPGDGFTQSTNPVPAPQSSSATMNIAPPTQVQRGTARRVAARRNPKGYFHGLPGRDGQNRHNIGRHWSEMTPEFGSVPNRPYEFHEMVAKRVSIFSRVIFPSFGLF